MTAPTVHPDGITRPDDTIEITRHFLRWSPPTPDKVDIEVTVGGVQDCAHVPVSGLDAYIRVSVPAPGDSVELVVADRATLDALQPLLHPDLWGAMCGAWDRATTWTPNAA